MNKNLIRCRCGHRVLGREVLRTEFYERRAPAGDPFLGESVREYVYVKFRCKRCKRMGENFIPDHRWDWKMLEPDHNELNDVERDFFLDEEPLSRQDIIDLHNHLENVSTFNDLHTALSADETKDESVERNAGSTSTRSVRSNEPRPGEPRPGEPRPSERQNDARPGDGRINDQTTSPKPPIPPIARDDSSRK